MATWSHRVDNAADMTASKVSMRRWCVAELGGTATVLDAFAGEQHLRRASYPGLPWRGIDVRKLGPDQYVGDNRRVLRAIDLRPFNLFDLDAYGEPFEQAAVIATRRPLAPGERAAMLLTISLFRIKLGEHSKILEAILGTPKGLACVPAAMLAVDRAEAWIVNRWRGTTVARRRALGHTNIGMVYDALIVEGRAVDPQPASAGTPPPPSEARPSPRRRSSRAR